jgi:phage tail sheath protein FI
MINFDSDYLNTPGEDAGQIADSGDDFILAPGALAIKTFNFDSGVNSGILGTAEYLNGYDLYEDRDIVEVDFLIAPSLNNSTDQTTVVNDLVTTAQSLRKDCVVVSSPARDDIVGLTNASTITDNIVDTANALTNSSYLVFDGNFLKVYDKFNDQYINIPAASSTAGIMAATDLNRAPWFSPAGSRRGQYLGITALNWTPTKGQRDTLYKAGVNPIANIPGQGSLLFGDKTKLGRPSAFDRINVRRLFLVLERAIGRAAEQALFEFNDEFTRAEFVNIVEPVLREVKGRRGITDFRVVCDETNNTPAVVDRNEFIANIFIKPARSINYITLNFVAVRTGVDFEEVVGTV